MGGSIALLLLYAAGLITTAATTDDAALAELTEVELQALQTAAATADPTALASLAAVRHADALHRAAHSPSVQEPTLALLRSSVRLAPRNPAYWNDLGVFEMRRGMHAKAAQRFQRALALSSPTPADATGATVADVGANAGADTSSSSSSSSSSSPGITHEKVAAAAAANLQRLRAVYWDEAALEKSLLHDHDRVEIEHSISNLTRVHVDDLAKPEYQVRSSCDAHAAPPPALLCAGSPRRPKQPRCVAL